MDIKIASLNCRGLNRKLKRRTIFQKCLSFDIVCLQETYITEEVEREWKQEWPGELVYSCGTNRSKGLIILINKKLSNAVFSEYKKNDRILAITIKIDELLYAIVNAYGPVIVSDKLDFINQLYSLFDNIKADRTVICGDFNIVHSNILDIIAGEKHNETVNKTFTDWISNCDLVDTWRLLHDEKKDFTWSRPTPFIARRLDYIFCNSDITPYILDSYHEIIYGTDHKLVIATFMSDRFKRGRSYWKFNDSLLH